MVEVPDSTTRYIQSDSGKPTKDLFNWMRNISQLLSGIGGGVLSGGVPCFSVHKNGSDQAGIGSGVETLVTWSTGVYNVGSYFTTNIWTPPAGKVHLSAAMLADAVTTTAIPFGILYIAKNGVAYRGTLGSLLGAATVGAVISIDDMASGTDTYAVHVFIPNPGGTSTIRGAISNTWFMGHWISP